MNNLKYYIFMSLKIFFLVIILFVVTRCKNEEQKNSFIKEEVEYVGCLPMINGINFYKFEISRVEMIEDFKIHLDKIIYEERLCKCYDEFSLAFLMTFYQNENDTSLSITSINRFAFDFSEVDAFFKYSSFIFFIQGIDVQIYKEIQNQKSVFYSLLPKVNKADIDDRHSGWFFIIENSNNVKFDYHFNCIR